MGEMPEIVVVAGAADQEVRTTIERLAIGRDVRLIFFDDLDQERWSTLGDRGQLGELIWCGIDIAREPDDMPGVEIRPFTCEEWLNVPRLEFKRTHPTTARELRRAERRRRK